MNVIWLNAAPDEPFKPLPAVVDECERILARDTEVFCRGGKLVDVGPVEVYVPKKRKRHDAPIIGVRELPVTETRRRVAMLAQCREWKTTKKAGAKPVDVHPPMDVMTTLWAMGRWPNVRPLKGIASAPFLRPDGTVFQTKAWDEETGFVLWPNGDFPTIPERSTRDHAVAALAELTKVFAPPADGYDGFPFASPEDALVPIAALLTLLARPAIEGPTPAFVFDATTPGTGKTLIADLVCMIAFGTEMPKSTFPEKPEELEKMLASLALAGAQVCGFDNLDPSVGFRGAPIDKVLSGRDIQFRKLGQTEAPTVRWNAVVIATGNNVQVLGDTVRRTLRCRQEPSVERPEERTGFRIPDIRGYVKERRGALVGAALTVLRAYVVAGSPKAKSKPWGSYEEWQRIVGGALEWVTGADVTLCRVSMSEDNEDPELAAAASLVSELGRLGGRYTAAQLVDLGFGQPSTTWNGIPVMESADYPALGDAIGALVHSRGKDGRPSTKSLGRALTRLKGRVFGGYKLDSKKSATVGHTHEWFANGVSGVSGVSFHSFASAEIQNSVQGDGRKQTQITQQTQIGGVQ